MPQPSILENGFLTEQRFYHWVNGILLVDVRMWNWHYVYVYIGIRKPLLILSLGSSAGFGRIAFGIRVLIYYMLGCKAAYLLRLANSRPKITVTMR